MGKKITNKVTWVGKIDWELNEFHGHEYSTEKGSSYNSFFKFATNSSSNGFQTVSMRTVFSSRIK